MRQGRGFRLSGLGRGTLGHRHHVQPSRQRHGYAAINLRFKAEVAGIVFEGIAKYVGIKQGRPRQPWAKRHEGFGLKARPPFQRFVLLGEVPQ